jgi:hypothetical protein
MISRSARGDTKAIASIVLINQFGALGFSFSLHFRASGSAGHTILFAPLPFSQLFPLQMYDDDFSIGFPLLWNFLYKATYYKLHRLWRGKFY